MTSKLAPHQISQLVYDEPSKSIRTTLQNLEIGIELDADDGDSVEARKPSFHQEVLVSSETASSGDILVEGDVRYFSEYQVAVKSSGVSGASIKITVQVSPSDTDDVWHNDIFNNEVLELGVPNGDGFDHNRKINIGPWRRARAVLEHNGFTAGFFKLYITGR